jgi:hypothetical protein
VSNSGNLAKFATMRRASSRAIQGPAGRSLRGTGRRFLPLLLATRFPQKKILQDEFPIAGSKRRIANPARYFAVTGLRSGFGFDDLI